MMKTIHGNLITLAEQGEFDVIIHGCNCFHAMGGGIAKQLADRYPEVEEADRKTEFGDRNKLGSYSKAIIEVNDHLFLVLNAYTQYMWSHGKDVFEYDAFQKFLNSITPYIQTYNAGGKLNIGFPQIGAGLAGGDWSRISKMIEKFSEDVSDYADVTVVIYQMKMTKDAQAVADAIEEVRFDWGDTEMTDKEMEIGATILPPLESIANRLGKSPDGILLNAVIKQLRKILSGNN